MWKLANICVSEKIPHTHTQCAYVISVFTCKVKDILRYSGSKRYDIYDVNNNWEFSPDLKVGTTFFRYKNQLFNAVQGNNVFLFWDLYETHNTLRVQSAELLTC